MHISEMQLKIKNKSFVSEIMAFEIVAVSYAFGVWKWRLKLMREILHIAAGILVIGS